MKSKYQWPASALTTKEMTILHSWRKQTGMPINKLIRQAIEIIDRQIKGGVK